MDVKNASGNIIFCCTSVSSFVAKDIQILTHAGYTVTPLLFIWHPKWRLPVTFLKQFCQLFYYLFTNRMIIVQFGGMHAFLPVIMAKIWRKPSLVILGGTDCAKFPSIAYGNFNKKILGWFTAQSVKHAMHLAPKHASLMWFDYTYDSSDYPAQGIQCFALNLKTPFTIIENGYDATVFKRVCDKKQHTFLTVAAGIELPNTMALKGIDLILKVAPHFSHCTFTIVGVPTDFNLPVQLKNVVVLPQQNAAQ
ncbi:MAG TPA: hypothetical protein PLO59_11500, partial [Bacteroidia bacterium]|nr:hypothetical protein [Bacteroidia bacterium]